MSQYLDKDGTSRIAENFLSKQAEQDAILRNLQFDLKEAEYALVKTVQGPAPLNIRALSRPLDDYMISGNTVQDGTPTPSNPVEVNGVGERTENLAPPLSEWIDGYINTAGGVSPADATNAEKTSPYIDIGDITTITYFRDATNGRFPDGSANYAWRAIGCYAADKSFLSRIGGSGRHPIITTGENALPIGTKYIRLTLRTYGEPNEIMCNEGSTMLPYEPYGYKLPFTCGGTEYPIYLGQVPTTRRVKKLVLTGEESGWQLERINSFGIANFALPDAVDSLISPRNYWICSHFKAQDTLIAQTKTEGVLLNLEGSVFFRIFSETVSTVDAFNSYLAAQYSAGTPVTVWYVLAEPETGIINEPLHKIGDYADTISMTQAGVEISTTKGFNAITTDTTVLPSNIEVKGVINNA